MSTSKSKWYYSEDGKPKGPISAREIAIRIIGDQIQAETLLWTKGMPQWKMAALVEAFSLFFEDESAEKNGPPEFKSDKPTPASQQLPKQLSTRRDLSRRGYSQRPLGPHEKTTILALRPLDSIDNTGLIDRKLLKTALTEAQRLERMERRKQLLAELERAPDGEFAARTYLSRAQKVALFGLFIGLVLIAGVVGTRHW